MGELTMKTEPLATGRGETSQTKESQPQLWFCFSFRRCTEHILRELLLSFLCVSL